MFNIFKYFNKPKEGPRLFNVKDEYNKKLFCQNSISTSRYNFHSFLPIFLYDQFKKSSNAYFLTVALLQQIPGVSPIGKYISLLSLTIVLCVLAIKEIIEDIKRHKSDSKVNNLPCKLFQNIWVNSKWGMIKVGDIIKVSSGETIPADMILLVTSDANQACYIQTSSLDGETNFKIRNCRVELTEFSSEEHWLTKKVNISCDAPNKDLYKFNGLIQICSEEPFPVTNDQILLRGCRLKNTEWVVGVVVYTGPETKIMLNSSAIRIKRSSVDRGIDYLTYILYSLLIALTLVSAIRCEYIYRHVLPKHWYMNFTLKSNSVIYTLLTFFILYHNFVPLSLLVTTEIVKVIQSSLINMDKFMYSDNSLNLPVVKTCSIIEDLGMINYIFSDKTGTLTCNEMILREFSIGKKYYIFNNDFIDGINSNKILVKEENFYLFFINLLLCNSVVPENVSNKDKISFQSLSPDESAIINALYEYGFKFVRRDNDGIEIEYLNEREFWKVILTFDFTSERQRMSVVVKSPKGKFYLLTKGADSIILNTTLNKTNDVYDSTILYLEQFAKSGLRTLCVAYKELDETEVNELIMKIDDVLLNIDNRESGINEIADKIEQNYILLGCTGIEDKLQEKVHESIKILREANIKIWMLTGDKLETAINIAFSCNLIDDSLQLKILNSVDPEDCFIKLTNIAKEESIKISNEKKIKNPKKAKSIALVVTGNDLKFILTEKCSNEFVNIAIYCKTVICSRISPSQKRDVLLLVKNRISNACTLAIGDGANDCSMIRAANIGVGIVGKEGLQAANTADFAIDQFKMLPRLLLAHGALSYRRICNCIYFTFYKNLLINLLPFYFNFSNLFSGKSLIHKLHFPFFNNLYTSLPTFCFGLLDQTSSVQAQTNLPYLYQSLRKNYKFGIKRFLFWTFNSFYHSFFLYIFSIYGLSNGVYNLNGYVISSDLLATWICGLTVILISLKAALEVRNWSLMSQIFLWSGILLYIICVFFFSRRLPQKIWFGPTLLDHDFLLISSPIYYFSLFIPVFVILPDFIFHCIRNTWFTPSHILITSMESKLKVDWNEPTAVLSLSSELFKSKEKKQSISKKYFGFAFSIDEESRKRASIVEKYDKNF